MKAHNSKILAYLLIMLLLVGNTGLSITTVLCACHGKKVYALTQPKDECCKHTNNKVKHEHSALFQADNLAKDSYIIAATNSTEKHDCSLHFHAAKQDSLLSNQIQISAGKCCNQHIEYIHLDKGQEFKNLQIISCECEDPAHDHNPCSCCNLKFLAHIPNIIYYAPAHPIWQLQPLDYNYLAKAPPLAYAANQGRIIINQVQNYRC